MIVKETERAEEKKEKQNKAEPEHQEKKRKKNIEFDSPRVASEMPWRCHLLSFF